MWKKNQKKKAKASVKFTGGPKYNDDDLIADGFRDDGLFPTRGRMQPGSGKNNTVIEEELPLPPGKQEIDPTEELLLKLHTSLVEFYAKHKPENLDEDVLTILMQFSIDAGQDALNKKLMETYGEDLDTFTPQQQHEPPPPYMSTLERKHARHRSLFDRTLPPPPKTVEEELDGKKADDDEYVPLPPPPRPKGSVKNELKRQGSDILGLNGAQPPPTISSQKLEILDHDDFLVLDEPVQPLEPRDLLEAFYFLHDESKLTKAQDGIEKFVVWVEKHSLEALSEKLVKKYGQSLEDVRGVALRRRNLEDTINEFYRTHDRTKIERADRRVLVKIINWAMKNGLRELNKKFYDRYGANVVILPDEENDEEDDDIDKEI